MTTEQMIEEALKEFEREFTYLDEDGNTYFFGSYDSEKNINTDQVPQIKDFIRSKLHLIATKSAEEERNKIGNLINSTKNDTEKLDLVVKYLNKDTNE